MPGAYALTVMLCSASSSAVIHEELHDLNNEGLHTKTLCQTSDSEFGRAISGKFSKACKSQ